MTAPWSARPANWGAPGHVDKGDEAEAILDQLEFVSGAYPQILKVKTADTNRNTTTTFADDPHMAATVMANATYAYRMFVSLTAGATPQMKFQFSTPSGTLVAGLFRTTTTIGASVGATHTVGGLVGTAVGYIQEGIALTGVTGGTFSVQWAQSVSNAANITLHQGSHLILQRLA